MTINDPPHKDKPSRAHRPTTIAAMLTAAGGAEAAAFAIQCLSPVPPDDLDAYDDQTLAAALLAFFRYAETRPLHRRKLRIYNPRRDAHGYDCPNTVIETIGMDTPFLLDSCLALLNARSLSIKALWHPVAAVLRDADGQRCGSGDGLVPLRESMIRVEIDRLTVQQTIWALEAELSRVFADVALTVGDWQKMLAKLDEAKEALKARPPDLPADELEEAQALLSWLRAEHFIFLGCRDYTLDSKNGDQILEPDLKSGLGLLSDPDRRVVRRGADRASLSPELKAFINEPKPLIITKANTRSTVHRRVHMDYIGVKRFGADGRVLGERRFVGLFTSEVYTRTVREIPFLRRKVNRALDRAGFEPRSHDGRALSHILETFPRDELFQISDDELLETSLGILRLRERPRTRIFLRWDKFDRFVSVLVFLPRESYSTNVRIRIMTILTEALGGRPTAYYPVFGDEPLARVHYIIGRNDAPRPDVDRDRLEAEIARAARSWDEAFEAAAVAAYGEEEGTRLYEIWHNAFGAGYREDFSASEALADIAAIEAKTQKTLHVRLFRDPADAADTLRLKLYHRGERLVLSAVLPILERLGLRILFEQSYPITRPGDGQTFIHELWMQEPQNRALDLARFREPFEDAFIAVWSGQAESDGLNRLVLRAALNWRDVTILRTIARYLRQAGIAYSRDYMEEALGNHPEIAALIIQLFHTRFDPALTLDRVTAEAEIRTRIEDALAQVSVLDEDRILRRFANVVDAGLRTSLFQDGLEGDPPVLSLKLNSRALLELPAPRPFVEIFVYSPRFEGVHLRFGKVARGGIRWSDRREDFRTEILGLVKAQRVKNAVIVPVGAKGGFVPKLIAPDAPREALQAEGVACYKLFIAALLGLTDNIEGDRIVPPAKTVRHDDDDPYLVVAADKGTAAFSDIANDIATKRGFWLGDAFASGGSEGYDHKKMGITARGAWEAVKRHFRELGVDIQTTPFRVVGCGDMSGDVFGNAMLLSRKIELVAAFDHRDIFVDPAPDPETSHAERARLFALPRSSWADYNQTLISKGGGVFSRKMKAIPLSPEIQALTGLTAKTAAPQDLIRALLMAEADLLFFGGIGTFVKAAGETHLDVGDRANDALRIDGKEIRCKVVGEGANLGCTQLGRVEYARAGGRINTDAIDNSAGVDTSDHEVNIKILLDAERRAGRLTGEARHALLHEMQDEVARLVLETNYAQTRALSISEAAASQDLSRQARFIDALEKAGLLDRRLERLPDQETFRSLESKGLGLTRPELAVLLAYAKLTLFEDILESDVPDDPYFVRELDAYFPQPIQERFTDTIPRHRLRREIIASRLANALVDMTGPTFAASLSEETERPESEVTRAYVVARAVHGAGALCKAIDAIDNMVPAALQTELHLHLKQHLQRQSVWLLRHGPRPLAIEDAVTRYQEGVRLLASDILPHATPTLRTRLESQEADFISRGVPQALAHDIAMLELLGEAGDVIAVAEASGRSGAAAGRALFTIAEALALDKLSILIREMKMDSYWDMLARIRLADEIAGHLRRMATRALKTAKDETCSGEAAALAWLERSTGIEMTAKMIGEFQQTGLSIAKLAVLESTLRAFCGA